MGMFKCLSCRYLHVWCFVWRQRTEMLHCWVEHDGWMGTSWTDHIYMDFMHVFSQSECVVAAYADIIAKFITICIWQKHSASEHNAQNGTLWLSLDQIKVKSSHCWWSVINISAGSWSQHAVSHNVTEVTSQSWLEPRSPSEPGPSSVTAQEGLIDVSESSVRFKEGFIWRWAVSNSYY